MLRHNSPWSTREIELLRKAHIAGESLEQIAATLGRSPRAVRAQLIRLRRRGEGPPLRRTPLHGLEIKGCHPIIRRIFEVARTEGHTYGSLAKRVGISRGAITALMTRNPSFMTVIAVAEALDIQLKAVYDAPDKPKNDLFEEKQQNAA